MWCQFGLLAAKLSIKDSTSNCESEKSNNDSLIFVQPPASRLQVLRGQILLHPRGTEETFSNGETQQCTDCMEVPATVLHLDVAQRVT